MTLGRDPVSGRLKPNIAEQLPSYEATLKPNIAEQLPSYEATLQDHLQQNTCMMSTQLDTPVIAISEHYERRLDCERLDRLDRERFDRERHDRLDRELDHLRHELKWMLRIVIIAFVIIAILSWTLTGNINQTN